MVKLLSSFALLLLYFIGDIAWSANQPPQNSDIVFAVKSAPRTLDPRFVTDATSFRIAQLLYKAPVKFNPQNQPEAWLCQWQTVNHSDAHYRFQLIGKPQFSDGSPITIDDVIATYQSVMDKNTGSPHRGSLQNIAKITKVNNHTADFILKKPDILFPANLVIGIMPQQMTHQKHLNTTIGSGDFTLLYWDGEGDVFLKRRQDNALFQFRVSKDDTVTALQILKGDIDIIQNGLSQELIHYLSKQPNLTVKNNQGSAYTYLGFNLQDNLLSNPKIRQAIAYGINRQEIIDHLFNKRAKVAQALLPKSHWSTDNNLEDIPYKPEKAKNLLASLGYGAQNPLQLSYKTSKSAFRLRIATLLQHQLKKVHIQTHIQSYDWGTFYGDIKKGQFQLYSLSWIGIKQPDIYRYVFHSDMIPPKGANRGRYISKQADYLIEQGDQALTIIDKQHYYYQLQHLLQNDLPYVSLWYENQFVVLSQKAKNYQLSADGNYLNLTSLKIHP